VPQICDIPDIDLPLYGVREPAQIEAAGQILPRPLATINLYDCDYKIRRHPEVLRLDHIDFWVKEYSYAKDCNIHLPHNDCHPCWLELRGHYEYIERKFEYERLKHNK